MKKTIIITIAMLCVFGAVVMFGAGRVSNDWQQPQQDETNIEVKPVIDKVEEEIESYPYVKSEPKESPSFLSIDEMEKMEDIEINAKKVEKK